jgi:hypothetical protein
MIAPLPPELADKLGPLGTPTAEFTGSIHRPRELVQREVTLLLIAAGLLTASASFFLPLVRTADAPDRGRVILLLAALGIYGLYQFITTFWVRLRPSLLRSLGVALFLVAALLLGSNQPNAKLAFLLGAAGLFFLPVTASLFRNRQMRVLIFPEGLVLAHAGGAHVVRWEEVLRLRQGTLLRPGQSFRNPIQEALWGVIYGPEHLTLECKNGLAIHLDASFRDIQDLGEILRRETLQPWLSAAMRDYEAGQTLHFGPLCVNQEGLRKVTEVLPWEAVKDIQIDAKGYLVIKAGWYTWLRMPGWDCANVHVLRALADYAKGRGDRQHKLAAQITDEFLKATQPGCATDGLAGDPHYVIRLDPPPSKQAHA